MVILGAFCGLPTFLWKGMCNVWAKDVSRLMCGHEHLRQSGLLFLSLLPPWRHTHPFAPLSMELGIDDGSQPWVNRPDARVI